MSLATDYAAAQDATFQQLIQAAMVQQAIAICNEATNTPNHMNRVRLATQILLSPPTYVYDFSMAVASQGIDKTGTDAAILTMISTVWNALAGVQ